MKLLLDEHYSPRVGEQLRSRGHDVISVQEEPALRGLSDPELFALAQTRKRALVSENVADFLKLHVEYRGRRRPHWGLVVTSNRAFPRGAPKTLGALVRALETLLRRHTGHEPASIVEWLQRPEHSERMR